jgi:UDP-N-acetylglucosamine 2-epimerase (non-hydrolysing)/GDP/UDP-N,N'-diacetylbacillosamine 2-epimerase (hydrolysing)
MNQRRIAVVTGTRAEYGLLYWLLKGLQQDPEFDLQIIVTGAHLSPVHGLTFRDIEKDGFRIDWKVDMLLASDTDSGVTRSLGLATIGFAEALEQLRPDLVVLLGDRYELLAAAQAALIGRIPVAHIAGGDTTEGAFDEAIRHSITKMAHLHFVTNEASAKRVRQLGENPEHIHNVGSPGIDQIRRVRLLDREELQRELGFVFRKRNLLITYHPETLDSRNAGEAVAELLRALDELDGDTGVVFTMPNADPGNHAVRERIRKFVQDHAHARAYDSLGPQKYLSVLSQVDAIVGNSSSGIMEAPSFRKPTVNVGDRQKGRPQAASIVNCPARAADILAAVKRALALDCSSVVNPYGDGTASEQIIRILKSIPDYRALVKKRFFDGDAQA